MPLPAATECGPPFTPSTVVLLLDSGLRRNDRDWAHTGVCPYTGLRGNDKGGFETRPYKAQKRSAWVGKNGEPILQINCCTVTAMTEHGPPSPRRRDGEPSYKKGGWHPPLQRARHVVPLPAMTEHGPPSPRRRDGEPILQKGRMPSALTTGTTCRAPTGHNGVRPSIQTLEGCVTALGCRGRRRRRCRSRGLRWPSPC